MNYMRLLTATVVVTMLGGAFGASVGGLLGYAVPSSLSVFFGAQRWNDENPGSPPTGAKVGVALDQQRSMAGNGAALGGAMGLSVGAVLGFLLGLVDQVLALGSALLNLKRKQAASAKSDEEFRPQLAGKTS